MKNATLTVTFNAEKLDALEFHMSRKDTDLQEELNDTVQKLYEKYVPQATREYLDDKISREPKVRELSLIHISHNSQRGFRIHAPES